MCIKGFGERPKDKAEKDELEMIERQEWVRKILGGEQFKMERVISV